MVKDKVCSNELDKRNIGVITHPISETGVSGFTNVAYLLPLLQPLCEKLFIITGDLPDPCQEGTYILHIGSLNGRESMPIWFIKQILIQLKVGYKLFELAKGVNVLIFTLGARTYLLPVVIAKILRKKIIVFATGSAAKTTKGLYSKMLFGIGGIIIPKLAWLLERLVFLFADKIGVESETAINFLKLEKFKRKITIIGAQWIDIELFRARKGINERSDIVGFIGRLSAEKGVMNFVRAIPLILRRHENIGFLIGGDGQLLDDLKEELKKSNCYGRVKFTRGIPHEEVPDYLNELKLLVLPSFSEGLPGIVQEAMACGTPVLATPVGGVPDLIKEGQTGFLLKDNSPGCIAEDVIRALEYPNLSEIVKNARKLIEEEYAFEAMVRKCRKALYEI